MFSPENIILQYHYSRELKELSAEGLCWLPIILQVVGGDDIADFFPREEPPPFRSHFLNEKHVLLPGKTTPFGGGARLCLVVGSG